MIEDGLIKIAENRDVVVITPKGEKETPTIPSFPPRALTNKQAQERFVKRIIEIAWEWHNNKGKSEWEKTKGMLHSILAMIDGESGTEPGFDITACHSEKDIEILREKGDDWYPIDESFNDNSMHEILYKIVENLGLEGDGTS